MTCARTELLRCAREGLSELWEREGGVFTRPSKQTLHEDSWSCFSQSSQHRRRRGEIRSWYHFRGGSSQRKKPHSPFLCCGLHHRFVPVDRSSGFPSVPGASSQEEKGNKRTTSNTSLKRCEGIESVPNMNFYLKGTVQFLINQVT